MQLSKKQVIALFLAGASANTPTDLMNSNCSQDTVVPSTPGTSLTTCSSMTTCTTNADCTTSGENCGTFVVQDVAQADTASYCMHTSGCKNVGKMGGKAWWVACNNADYSTVAEADLVDPLVMLNNVASIVKNSVEHTTAWDAAQDLKVMAWDNYQTGWWIRGADGLYTETDKPIIRLCETTDDCGTGECCANWPDTNNTRCIAEDLGGVVKDLPPFTSWTPTCIAGTGDGPPISAEDDLANEALAQAAQAIEEFDNLVIATWKEKAGYANMSDDEKAKWQEEWDEETAKDEEKAAAEKVAAGYADLTTEQKTVFDAEFLKWGKAVFEKCQENEEGLECDEAWDLRESVEEARNEADYYEMDSAARFAFDQAQEEAQAAFKSKLVAAWIDKNKDKIEEGQQGSACSATQKCKDSSHCCGTATPSLNEYGDKSGQIEGVCAHKAQNFFEYPGTGIKYDHQCGANALIAGAATLLAAAYAL